MLNVGSHGMFVLSSLGLGDDVGSGRGSLGSLLDLVAINSHLSQQWDQHPEYWERSFAQVIKRRELDLLNTIRERHAKPPITGSAADDVPL